MDVLSYQKEAIALIDNAFLTKHISHAYIFEGPKGSGKIDAAYYFAMKMLCNTHSACGECENCLKVKMHIHSNIFLIEPMQNTIRKDQINTLIHEGHMSSVNNKERIYIIKDANLMNRASANAFLKTLEEPSADNYFILLTDNINSLLETITSRCQIIHFKPIQKAEIEVLLKEQVMNDDYAYLLSELFASFDEAIDFFTNHQSLIELIFKTYNDLVNNKNLYLNYLFNKQILQTDDNIYYYLASLIIFQKQLLRYLDSKEYHFKLYLDTLNKETLTTSKIINNIEAINNAKSKIDSNVNLDLAIANMCIKMEKGDNNDN